MNRGDVISRVKIGRPVDAILSGLANAMEEEDAQYFDKSSAGVNMVSTNPNIKLLQADYSSRMSQGVDHQSSYHMELLEEKREEIQRIISKRQRKAALVSIVKANEQAGKPTMAGDLGRKGASEDSILPDITPQRKRPAIVVNGDKDTDMDETHTESLLGKTNMRKLKKYDKGESDSDIALSDRAPGALHDPDDPEERRIDKLQKEVNEKYKSQPRITLKLLNSKETRPPVQPELETMRRAAMRGKKGVVDVEALDEDKHEKRVEKVTNKLIQMHKR